MTNSIYLTDAIVFNLQLFAEGAGAEGGAPTAETAPVAGEQQAAETAPVAGEQTEPDPDAEFEEAINGKYKEQFGKRVNDIINKRLRSTHRELDGAKKQINDFKALAEAICDYQGLDYTDNVQDIIKALDEAERPGLMQRALKNNVDEEMQKKIDKWEREDKRRAHLAEKQEEEEQKQRFWAEKFKEAEAFKAQYPAFDFDAEMRGFSPENEQFRELVASGVNVESAYRVAHRKEIEEALIKSTAEKVRESVVNDVRANGLRPSENGSSAPSASSARRNISKLTTAEMDELVEHSRRGERITLT